jgi:hypothetical protein
VGDGEGVEKTDGTFRADTWHFLETNATYERFTVVLILVNVFAFCASTVFNEQYNVNVETGKYIGPTCSWCDAAFFGDKEDNGLAGGSYLEFFTVACFTIDYCLRLWSCVESPEYPTRFVYVVSFFSLVDLASTIPFYIEMALPINFFATQFLRMLRLFRMMRVEGRYSEAFTMMDDVFRAKSNVLLTAGFVGMVVWMISSGFYYVTERSSLEMIYCPTCPEVDNSKCTIDVFGFVDCKQAGCPGLCWNEFESIPSAMFQTMVNLFGEYPLATQYSGWGRVVGSLVALFACAVFGIPCLHTLILC